MSINFTANLLSHPTVQHKSSAFGYKPAEVSLVELDKKNKHDVDAIRQTSQDWMDKGGQFISNYYHDMVKPFEYADVEKEHFYALTTQKSDFENLKGKDILGVMMFAETRNPENEIEWLETNPQTKKASGLKREYKDVGKKLVEYVRANFKQKDIFVQSADSAIGFYKKLGAEQPNKKFPKKCQLYFRV